MERPHDYVSLTKLNISSKGLTELPSWISECKNLKSLNCSGNQIIHLDNLPQSLKILNCNGNEITHLDNLPQTLTHLRD